MTNLGIGGSYHSNNINSSDSTFVSRNELTQHMATFLMFLTNTEAGGATIFPNLGLTIWPKKGDAVFW